MNALFRFLSRSSIHFDKHTSCRLFVVCSEAWCGQIVGFYLYGWFGGSRSGSCIVANAQNIEEVAFAAPSGDGVTAPAWSGSGGSGWKDGSRLRQKIQLRSSEFVLQQIAVACFHTPQWMATLQLFRKPWWISIRWFALENALWEPQAIGCCLREHYPFLRG